MKRIRCTNVAGACSVNSQIWHIIRGSYERSDAQSRADAHRKLNYLLRLHQCPLALTIFRGSAEKAATEDVHSRQKVLHKIDVKNVQRFFTVSPSVSLRGSNIRCSEGGSHRTRTFSHHLAISRTRQLMTMALDSSPSRRLSQAILFLKMGLVAACENERKMRRKKSPLCRICDLLASLNFPFMCVQATG